MHALVGVTGATGALGGRVAHDLGGVGMPLRLVVRDEARAPKVPGAEIAVAGGYHDSAGMRAALRGVDTLFLVSGRESATRAAEHLSAVDAAVAAGVRRIVYTSFLGAAAESTFTFARDHHATEERIRSSGLAFTFLRNSMYVEYMGLVASPAGVIAGPAGEGRFAPVSRDVVADVAVAVLTTAAHDGKTYDITGPELYTFHDVAAELTRASSRQVFYHAETLDEAYASRGSYGAPAFEVEGWVTSYVAISRGELEVVSDSVRQLTGRRPHTLPEFLAHHPETYAHLAS
jgi:uncharacterized protein YbjT (DUF2867 family)